MKTHFVQTHTDLGVDSLTMFYIGMCVYMWVCEPVDKRITDFHALKTQTLYHINIACYAANY